MSTTNQHSTSEPAGCTVDVYRRFLAAAVLHKYGGIQPAQRALIDEAANCHADVLEAERRMVGNLEAEPAEMAAALMEHCQAVERRRTALVALFVPKHKRAGKSRS